MSTHLHDKAEAHMGSAKYTGSNQPYSHYLPKRIFGRYAGFVSRAIGLIIDQVIIGLVSVGLFLVVKSILLLAGMNVDRCAAFVPIDDVADIFTNVCRLARGGTYFLSVMFGPTYYVILWMLTGQTIGMAIVGVRVVRADGANIVLRQSLLRMIGFAICLLSLGFGFVRVLWDVRRQGWHDKIANTFVVYSWKHVPVAVVTQPIVPLPVDEE